MSVAKSVVIKFNVRLYFLPQEQWTSAGSLAQRSAESPTHPVDLFVEVTLLTASAPACILSIFLRMICYPASSATDQRAGPRAHSNSRPQRRRTARQHLRLHRVPSRCQFSRHFRGWPGQRRPVVAAQGTDSQVNPLSASAPATVARALTSLQHKRWSASKAQDAALSRGQSDNDLRCAGFRRRGGAGRAALVKLAKQR